MTLTSFLNIFNALSFESPCFEHCETNIYLEKNRQFQGQSIKVIEMITNTQKTAPEAAPCFVMNSDGLYATVRRISIKSKEMKSVFPLPLFCKETLHFDKIR